MSRSEIRIAVVGAAGMSGTHLVKALKKGPQTLRAVVHNDAGAKRATAAGADEVVAAEFGDHTSLQRALESVDAIYMIPPSMDPNEDAYAINVLRAAEECGAKRFVYASVLHPHTPPLRHHMRKARAEAAIRESSLEWTILQPAMYAQMVIAMFGAAPAGVVRIPFNIDLIFSVVDLRELSEVAVEVLTNEGHEYASYEISGPHISMAEMVRTAGRVRGVELVPERIAPSSFPLPPKFANNPSAAADMLAMWKDYDRHGLRGNNRVLSMLLKRSPASFEEIVRSTLAPATN